MFVFSNPTALLSFPGESRSLINQMQAILVEFQVSGVRAVVGGGILRDLILDRPYKDIDIFAHAGDADQEKILTTLRQMGCDARVIVGEEATQYLTFTDVSAVIEATHPARAVPVQVILMAANNESPERLIERLDLGPCQIGMDFLNQFWVTKQFAADIFNAQFTVTRSESRDIERSTKRYHRLLQKYPGWGLVIP